MSKSMAPWQRFTLWLVLVLAGAALAPVLLVGFLWVVMMVALLVGR